MGILEAFRGRSLAGTVLDVGPVAILVVVGLGVQHHVSAEGLIFGQRLEVARGMACILPVARVCHWLGAILCTRHQELAQHSGMGYVAYLSRRSSESPIAFEASAWKSQSGFVPSIIVPRLVVWECSYLYSEDSLGCVPQS
jgi:hypothetical protein